MEMKSGTGRPRELWNCVIRREASIPSMLGMRGDIKTAAGGVGEKQARSKASAPSVHLVARTPKSCRA